MVIQYEILILPIMDVRTIIQILINMNTPNPTGGARIRDPIAQPVTGWNYL